MQAHSLLQHECQIFIGSKISLSFYFYFFSPLWVQITLGSTSKSLKILQIPAAPLSGMPAAGWCSLWCVKLLKGQEDTRISTLPPIRNGLTSSDRWLLTDGDEELFSRCTPPLSSFQLPPFLPPVLPLMLAWRCHLGFDKLLIRSNNHFHIFSTLQGRSGKPLSGIVCLFFFVFFLHGYIYVSPLEYYLYCSDKQVPDKLIKTAWMQWLSSQYTAYYTMY